MLRQYLLDNWQLFFKTEKPLGINVVPLSSCSKEYGNNLVLIFLHGAIIPEYVLKITKNKQFGFKLRREYAALEVLSSQKIVSDYIPEPYYIGEKAQCPFFFQAGIPGTSLQKLLRVNGYDDKNNVELLGQAVDLLAKINSAKGNVDNDGGEINEVSDFFSNDSTFKRFENANVPILQMTEIMDYLVGVKESNDPFFVHGDYWPANIIISQAGDEIQGIIDWEFCSQKAMFPFDIIWFLLTIVFDMYKYDINSVGSTLDAFKYCFYKGGDSTELIPSLYHRYATQIRFECGQFSMLLKSVLAIASVREFRAYGKSYEMDNIYLELFKYAVQKGKCIYD